MKHKYIWLILVLSIIICILPLIHANINISKADAGLKAQTIAVKNISTSIVAFGAVHSLQEATLHFQTSGKLTYLPFKEGDKVYQGQTIAQLDTYALQRQLSQALNTYQSTRDTFDQAQQNAQNNVLQNQQKPTIIAPEMDQTNAINDAVKRILNQNQMNLNNSVINVELSNYALQLATLTAPFDGVISHEDVTVPYQNVTALTGFTLVDPTHTVFRANILPGDIDFVGLGSNAIVHLSGSGTKILGTVTNIYPQKITLANGQSVYQVDITSNSDSKIGLVDQSGTVIITSAIKTAKSLIPSWTVLNSSKVWVLRDGKQMLINVVLGEYHGNSVEVVDGIKSTDRIITNPDAIASDKYLFL